jgi:hypothetical protein
MSNAEHRSRWASPKEHAQTVLLVRYCCQSPESAVFGSSARAAEKVSQVTPRVRPSTFLKTGAGGLTDPGRCRPRSVERKPGITRHAALSRTRTQRAASGISKKGDSTGYSQKKTILSRFDQSLHAFLGKAPTVSHLTMNQPKLGSSEAVTYRARRLGFARNLITALTLAADSYGSRASAASLITRPAAKPRSSIQVGTGRLSPPARGHDREHLADMLRPCSNTRRHVDELVLPMRGALVATLLRARRQ